MTDIAFQLGQLTAWLLPLGLGYLTYKKIKKNNAHENEEIKHGR